MRIRQVGVVVVAIAALTTGCGDDSDGASGSDEPAVSADGPPRDASRDDFCSTGNILIGDQQFYDTQESLELLAKVGTPKGIPAEARAGLEIAIPLWDQELEEFEAAEDELTLEDKDKIQAFHEYYWDECEPEGGWGGES